MRNIIKEYPGEREDEILFTRLNSREISSFLGLNRGGGGVEGGIY